MNWIFENESELIFSLPTLKMKLRSKVLVMILLLGVIQISCEPQFIPENCTGEDKTLLEQIEIEGLNFENCGSSDLLPGSESYVVITSKFEFNILYITLNIKLL